MMDLIGQSTCLFIYPVLFSSISLFLYNFFSLSLSGEKPLSVEVGEASTLMLLGAEQENAELRRQLEELQAQQEVGVQGLDGGLTIGRNVQ